MYFGTKRRLDCGLNVYDAVIDRHRKPTVDRPNPRSWLVFVCAFRGGVSLPTVRAAPSCVTQALLGIRVVDFVFSSASLASEHGSCRCGVSWLADEVCVVNTQIAADAPSAILLLSTGETAHRGWLLLFRTSADALAIIDFEISLREMTALCGITLAAEKRLELR